MTTLKELQAVIDGATIGDWVVLFDKIGYPCVVDNNNGTTICEVSWTSDEGHRFAYECSQKRAEFICLAAVALPAALKLLIESKGRIEQLLDDLSSGSMVFPGHGVCQQAWDEAVSTLAAIEAFERGEY